METLLSPALEKPHHEDGGRTGRRIGLSVRPEFPTTRILRTAGIAYALSLAAVVLYINRGFYHDDAYITLRYAKNCIAGLGMVWNGGEYVQGYTNFLHLALISLLGLFNIDLVRASQLVGVISLIGLLGVMLLFQRVLKGEARMSFGHLPAILVITSVPMLVWTVGGLEGTLFSLLVAIGSLLLLVAVDSPKGYRFYIASGLAFGFGFLTRPDGVVFIAVSLAWLLWLSRKEKSGGFRNLMAYAVGVAIIVIPYVAWQVTYYGDVVPNTFYAKMGAPLSIRLISGIIYLGRFALHPPFLPILVICSLAYTFSKGLWCSKLTYLALSVAAYVLFVLQAGGDHMPTFRLLLPVVPLMSVILAIALSRSFDPNSKTAVGCITLAIILLTSLQVFDNKLNVRREDPASFVGTIVGKYIATAWPAGSLVALNTAGSTPYFAERLRFIDMLGLNDPVIAQRKIVKLELEMQRIPGHLKGDGAYVLSRHPDFIIIGPAEGRVASQPMLLSDLEISRDPSFAHDYAMSQVVLDGDGKPNEHGDFTFTYYARVRR